MTIGSYIRREKASRPREGFIPNPKLKLLEQVSEVMRFTGLGVRSPLAEPRNAR